MQPRCSRDAAEMEGLQEACNLVKQAEAVLLLLTENVFKQPRCLVLIHEAVALRKRIIPVHVEGRGYDFQQGHAWLGRLEEELTRRAETRVDANGSWIAVDLRAISAQSRFNLAEKLLRMDETHALPSAYLVACNFVACNW